MSTYKLVKLTAKRKTLNDDFRIKAVEITDATIEHNTVTYTKNIGLTDNFDELREMMHEDMKFKLAFNDIKRYNYINKKYAKDSTLEVVVVTSDDKDLRALVKTRVQNNLHLEDYNLQDEEVKWLYKNVSRIKAYLPNKQYYIDTFENKFATKAYTVKDKQWTFGFRLYLKADADLENIPVGLLMVGQNDPMNPNNPALNRENKTFNSTAYIWKLVDNYPEYFQFV